MTSANAATLHPDSDTHAQNRADAPIPAILTAAIVAYLLAFSALGVPAMVYLSWRRRRPSSTTRRGDNA